MLARLIVAASLSLWPLPSYADHAEPRPTAVEVAGAMVPCLLALEADEHDPAPAARITARGGSTQAVVAEGDEITLHLIRAAPNPTWHEAGLAFSLDDDPVSPAMPLVATSALRGVGPPLEPAAVACFEQEYRRLLRP